MYVEPVGVLMQNYAVGGLNITIFSKRITGAFKLVQCLLGSGKLAENSFIYLSTNIRHFLGTVTSAKLNIIGP